jgi:hypothetical protein
MPVKFDVAKFDNDPWVKGDIVSVIPDGMDFSQSASGFFIGVEITDATYEQANHYIHGWQIDFVFTLLAQNASGWRYQIEVDPAVLDVSETAKANIKSEMQDHVEGSEYWEGASVFAFSANSMTVDIPKNGPYQSANGMSNLDYLQWLKRDFSDKFKTTIGVRRYYFDPTEVDKVPANGSVQITKAQALARIIDRLDL